jgi:hypothetical protein
MEGQQTTNGIHLLVWLAAEVPMLMGWCVAARGAISSRSSLLQASQSPTKLINKSKALIDPITYAATGRQQER